MKELQNKYQNLQTKYEQLKAQNTKYKEVLQYYADGEDVGQIKAQDSDCWHWTIPDGYGDQAYDVLAQEDLWDE